MNNNKLAFLTEQLELITNIKEVLSGVTVPLTPKFVDSFFTKVEDTIREKIKKEIDNIK